MLKVLREWSPMRWAVLAVLAVVAYLGWREFWFLTDDSYITFRYIQNSLRGLGHTWNPPPFRPVEGYSNFLWMILLEGVWRLFGVEPPDAANWVSLGFSYGTLALGFCWVWRLTLPPSLERYRFALAAAVLVGALSNRTFLAWMSSGLETALFTFCVTLWAVALLELERSRRPGLFAWVCAAAAGAALTRPDGGLLVVATGLLGLGYFLRVPPRGRWVTAALPLLAVPLHLLWRRAYYGEWVPNTYFAKHVAAWPESGLRYALSFVLEYALWVWLGVGLVAAGVVVRRLGVREALAAVARRPGTVAVVAVLGAHFAYFTLRVGGDHFEYRVYAHLVLPLWITFVGFLAALRVGRAVAAGLLAGFLLLSLPLPWVHYLRTRDNLERNRTFMLIEPIAEAFPAVVRPYVALFDEHQAWLIRHLVGMRHQEHKVFHLFMLKEAPPREVGERLRYTDGWPALFYPVVGVAGWVLPEVAILDAYGLNDRVVARHPVSPERLLNRGMAHDRKPPPGYFECFMPDVGVSQGRLWRLPRPEPLTAERIRECEARFDPHFHPWLP